MFIRASCEIHGEELVRSWDKHGLFHNHSIWERAFLSSPVSNGSRQLHPAIQDISNYCMTQNVVLYVPTSQESTWKRRKSPWQTLHREQERASKLWPPSPSPYPLQGYLEHQSWINLSMFMNETSKYPILNLFSSMPWARNAGGSCPWELRPEGGKNLSDSSWVGQKSRRKSKGKLAPLKLEKCWGKEHVNTKAIL